MPPKRKRSDADVAIEAPSSTRVTQSSSKTGTAESGGETTDVAFASQSPSNKTGGTRKGKGRNAQAIPREEDGGDTVKSGNKNKKATAKSKATSKTTAAAGSKISTFRNYKGSSNPASSMHEPSRSISADTKNASSPAATSASNTKTQPFMPSHVLSLFATYADADDANVIGPDGFERLCADTGLEMEGAKPLLLSWLLDATEMGKLTKDEWVKGLEDLQICTLPQLALAVQEIENLLVWRGDPVKRTKSGSSPYDRSRYWTYVESPAERKKAFSKLYAYCFAMAKPPHSRNIDIETATAFWSVLLIPQYPIMAEVIEFINEKRVLKGVNKDLWSMMLEFAQTVSPSLENYEADGAWPTTLDEFVVWKKGKVGGE